MDNSDDFLGFDDEQSVQAEPSSEFAEGNLENDDQNEVNGDHNQENDHDVIGDDADNAVRMD